MSWSPFGYSVPAPEQKPVTRRFHGGPYDGYEDYVPWAQAWDPMVLMVVPDDDGSGRVAEMAWYNRRTHENTPARQADFYYEDPKETDGGDGNEGGAVLRPAS